MVVLKFQSSEMLRQKVWMAKRRDEDFLKLCVEMLCIYVIWNVFYVCVMWYVYVCVMWYVCVHDEVCVCVLWCVCT